MEAHTDNFTVTLAQVGVQHYLRVAVRNAINLGNARNYPITVLPVSRPSVLPHESGMSLVAHVQYPPDGSYEDTIGDFDLLLTLYNDVTQPGEVLEDFGTEICPSLLMLDGRLWLISQHSFTALRLRYSDDLGTTWTTFPLTVGETSMTVPFLSAKLSDFCPTIEGGVAGIAVTGDGTGDYSVKFKYAEYIIQWPLDADAVEITTTEVFKPWTIAQEMESGQTRFVGTDGTQIWVSLDYGATWEQI
jgi:hypothetical protein